MKADRTKISSDQPKRALRKFTCHKYIYISPFLGRQNPSIAIFYDFFTSAILCTFLSRSIHMYISHFFLLVHFFNIKFYIWVFWIIWRTVCLFFVKGIDFLKWKKFELLSSGRWSTVFGRVVRERATLDRWPFLVYVCVSTFPSWFAPGDDLFLWMKFIYMIWENGSYRANCSRWRSFSFYFCVMICLIKWRLWDIHQKAWKII